MRSLLILASVLASVGLIACSADTEESLPNVLHGAGGRGAAPAEEDARFATGNAQAVPVPNVEQPASCRQGAFCDGFESSGYSDQWHAAVTNDGGSLSLGNKSATLGNASLRATTRGELSSAFLLREHGAVAASWSGELAFAFKVSELPGEYLGGPELVVKTPDGPISVRVSWTPDGVFLEQKGTAECVRDRCTDSRTMLALARPNHWYAIRLGFEVNPSSAPPYGIIETSINGEAFTSHDLTVPMYEGSAFFNGGITEGDRVRPAIADLDDVSVFVR